MKTAIYLIISVAIFTNVNMNKSTSNKNIGSVEKKSSIEKDSLVVNTSESTENDKIAFLKRFAQISRAEGMKYRIPLSCILAIAAVKSDFGRSKNVVTKNNYFNLCHQEQLAIYETSWHSFRHFSLIVTSTKVAVLPNKDYKLFLKMVDNSNLYKDKIATEAKEIIEKYKLSELDYK